MFSKAKRKIGGAGGEGGAYVRGKKIGKEQM